MSAVIWSDVVPGDLQKRIEERAECLQDGG